jgi:hypothetical protein
LAEMPKETLPGGKSAGSVPACDALNRRREADTELERLEAEHASDLAMRATRFSRLSKPIRATRHSCGR